MTKTTTTAANNNFNQAVEKIGWGGRRYTQLEIIPGLTGKNLKVFTYSLGFWGLAPVASPTTLAHEVLEGSRVPSHPMGKDGERRRLAAIAFILEAGLDGAAVKEFNSFTHKCGKKGGQGRPGSGGFAASRASALDKLGMTLLDPEIEEIEGFVPPILPNDRTRGLPPQALQGWSPPAPAPEAPEVKAKAKAKAKKAKAKAKKKAAKKLRQALALAAKGWTLEEIEDFLS